ncbi:MAG: hypothetical protein IPL61_29475 [Myxococcales bacterium]|nr:hypothetical protein [Myxococcales bacterium]
MRWYLQLKLHMLLLVLGAACAGRAVPAHPEVLVEDLRLVAGRAANPWRPGGRVSFEALELIADVAREVRYFSPEVDPAFDWAAWLAVGHELAARTPDMQALVVSLDEWVRQAAPGARLTLGRSRGPVPEPGAVAAPRLGPVIRNGATTEGIYVAFVDGAANEPATAIFSYWQPVPRGADCRKLSAVARVERLSPEAQGRLVMVASTGGFDEARSDVALAAGEVVLEADVPSSADSLELAVRFAGRGELVLRELKVSCDGRPASTVPLAAGDLRGIGSSLYERVDSGAPVVSRCVVAHRGPRPTGASSLGRRR